MKPFPNRWREIVEPKIVAGGCHQKENQQRKESQSLEWELSEAAVPRIADQQTHKRRNVTQGVKLNERKHPMYQGHHEHCHSKVAAIIKKRQKARIEAA